MISRPPPPRPAPRRLLLLVAIAGSCSAPARRATPPGTPPAPPDAAPPVAAPALGFRDGFDAVGPVPAPWRLELGGPDRFAVVTVGDATALHATPDRGQPQRLALTLAEPTRYRGQRVEIKTRIRFASPVWWAGAQVGLDVDRGDALADYGDRGRTLRIRSADWQQATAVVDIADDAVGLELFIATYGLGSLDVDQVELAVVGPAGTGDVGPRPLDAVGLDNLIAFARLYGVVRYFHPSDEAAALSPDDWAHFVRAGAIAVEPAADPAALEAALRALFTPLAPTLELGATAAAPPAHAPDAHRLVWHHIGLGQGDDSPYRSARRDLDAAAVTVTTSIDPVPLRGARIQVRANLRGEVDATGDAGLWMSGVGADPTQQLYSEPEMQAPIGADWAPIVVEGTVPSDATQLAIGVQMIGRGTVAIDELTITRLDGARPRSVAVPAWGRALGPRWQLEAETPDRVRTMPRAAGCDRRPRCLVLEQARAVAPAPWTTTVRGVAVRIPLAVERAGARTTPAVDARWAPGTEPLLATDRASRLAAVIIAWNVLQHFYPYFDVVGTDWAAALGPALRDAAIAPGYAAQHATLRRLVSVARDGHGFLSHASEPQNGAMPWSWQWAEGALVIARVAPQCAGCDLIPGDVVTAIDGVPTADAIATRMAERTFATPQHTRLMALGSLRVGPVRQPRRITVRRGAVEHEVAHPLIDGATVTGLDEVRPANGSEVAPGIRYLDAGNYPPDQWPALAAELAKADVVLIDMRGYPVAWNAAPLGHLSATPLASPQWHVPTVPRPDRVGMTSSAGHWDVPPATPRFRRAVFLTDERAVSAAETFMGIVAGHHLGEIVGAPTAGTNGNINPVGLPGGFSMMWTGMKVLAVDGSRHHGVGIQPTIPATPTIAGIAAGRDEVLARAIEVARQPPRRPHR